MPKTYTDCIYCKGKGFTFTQMMNQRKCKECGGTGTKEVKVNRKSVLISADKHERLSDLAHEHKKSIVDFMTYVIEYFENKKG